MKNSLMAIAVAMTLAACGDERPAPVKAPTPIVAAPAPAAPASAAVAGQTPQVVVVQQPAAPANNTMGDAMIGAAIGSMIGNSLSRPSAPSYSEPSRTVVNKTVIVKNYNAPAAAPAKPSLFSSFKPSPSKTVPAAPSSVTPSTASKLSLTKSSSSYGKTFGGFRRRR